MSNIILPKVQILDTISDEAKILIEQDGEINRFAVTNLGGGDISINLEDTINGNTNPINANTLNGKPESMLSVANANNANTLDGKPENMLSVANANTLEGYSVQSLFDKIYPVGSIYMAVNAVSPATLFGGTWEALEDRFLLGAGTTYSAGATGGETTQYIGINNLPRDTITFIGGNSGDWSVGYWSTHGQGDSSWIARPLSQQSSYSNTALNNMPPYLAVYMWKRTA